MYARISAETIQQVNDQTDLVSLIGEYTRLERRGSEWWGCCPFHSEKTPSFHVAPDKHLYHCFGCGQGGNAISFCMEMEKISFADAVKELAQKAGIEIKYDGRNAAPQQQDESGAKQKELYKELYSRMAGTFQFLLTQTEAGRFAYDYVKRRGISEETARTFMLGYAPADRMWLRRFLEGKHYSAGFLDESGLFSKKNPRSAFFYDRLLFPIFDRRGDVVAFGGRILHGDGPKYLNTGDLVQYKKGETLYAFNFARQTMRAEKAVIFCEGYMDVIAYHQCGIANAVAPLGTALTEQQLDLVRPFVDTVLLSFDSDGAGRAATHRAILLCRGAGLTVKIIRLSGGKDPAEIMLNEGAESLTNSVRNAILDSDYLLSDLRNTYQVDTPEGKTKAALAFFPYIDSLQSDIQKETCLDLLCQTFSLKPEAVRRDFNNRDAAQKRIETRQQTQERPEIKEKIKLNAEIRSLLAVIANLDFYPQVRLSLSVDDFEDPVARDMFIMLEECYRSDAMTYSNILAKCDEAAGKLITSAVMSGEYGENSRKTIEDCIQLIQKNSLIRKRDRLVNRIRQCVPHDKAEQDELEAMILEKMSIDSELNKQKEMSDDRSRA